MRENFACKKSFSSPHQNNLTDMNSKLNCAHQEERKARRLLRNGKYSDAIQKFKKATDLLSLVGEIKNPDVKFSIELQKEQLLKQEKVVKVLESLANERKHLSKISHWKMTTSSSDDKFRSRQQELFDAIQRELDNQDSLLAHLTSDKRPQSQGPDSRPLASADSPAYTDGVKLPKNQSQVVEELVVVTEHMKRNIELLMGEMCELRLENAALRDTVARLREVPATDLATSGLPAAAGPNQATPEGCLKDQDARVVRPKEDVLPPLEMPEFDFTKLSMAEGGVSSGSGGAGS